MRSVAISHCGSRGAVIQGSGRVPGEFFLRTPPGNNLFFPFACKMNSKIQLLDDQGSDLGLFWEKCKCAWWPQNLACSAGGGRRQNENLQKPPPRVHRGVMIEQKSEQASHFQICDQEEGTTLLGGGFQPRVQYSLETQKHFLRIVGGATLDRSGARPG